LCGYFNTYIETILSNHFQWTQDIPVIFGRPFKLIWTVFMRRML